MPLQYLMLHPVVAVNGSKPQLPDIVASRPNSGRVLVTRSQHKSYLQGASIFEIKVEYDPKILGNGTIAILEGAGIKRPLIGEVEDFPLAWGRWVSNPEVQASALNHIFRKKPAASSLMFDALVPMCPEEAFDNWMSLARAILRPEQVASLDKKTRGNNTALLAGRIKAMPIRIAQYLGSWREPVPRHAYKRSDNPDKYEALPVDFTR